MRPHAIGAVGGLSRRLGVRWNSGQRASRTADEVVPEEVAGEGEERRDCFLPEEAGATCQSRSRGCEARRCKCSLGELGESDHSAASPGDLRLSCAPSVVAKEDENWSWERKKTAIFS